MREHDPPESNRFPARTIDILIPTRQRPEALEKTIRSLSETAAKPDTISIAIYVDLDDKPSGDKVNEIAKWAEGKLREVILCIGKPVLLSDTYNELAGWTEGEIIMYAADDLVFETQGWDDRIREEFLACKDRILLAWCRDPARPGYGQFPDHGFLSRWSLNTIKYVFPNFPPHPGWARSTGVSFTDIWVNALYAYLNRTKLLSDVCIRHAHWHPRHDGASHEKPLDDNYVRHAILTTFRKTPEYRLRVKEIPQHAAVLQKFIDWVAGGGLEREVERNHRIDLMYAENKEKAGNDPKTPD